MRHKQLKVKVENAISVDEFLELVRQKWNRIVLQHETARAIGYLAFKAEAQAQGMSEQDAEEYAEMEVK